MSLKMQADIDRLSRQVAELCADNQRMRAELAAMRDPLDKQLVATLERDFSKALMRALKEIFSRG